MKKKIIGILVMTLLITAGTIVVADWDEEDGHKMHYPQLPDPNGWDVDWAEWYLGDDWECSESGPVLDIHFWYSWYNDYEWDIDNIDVSIWSNDPNVSYSRPKDELWQRMFFYPDDFKIAGPWNGTQGWYIPSLGAYEPENHWNYYQINIMDIKDPFEQDEGEIYWLVITMEYTNHHICGWKTSESEQFLDTAVYGSPSDGWTAFYDPITQQKLDLAFVITGEDNDPPWDPVIEGPDAIEVGRFYPFGFSSLDPNHDMVSYYIKWGDGDVEPWGPFQASGVVYTKSHAWMTQGNYTIEAKAKDTHGAESGWGELRITVPREKVITNSFFFHLLEQFPILSWLFQRLIGLQ